MPWRPRGGWCAAPCCACARSPTRWTCSTCSTRGTTTPCAPPWATAAALTRPAFATWPAPPPRRAAPFCAPPGAPARRATPALGSAFDRALERTGVPLTELYRQRAQYEALHALAELLTDYDERLRLWRFRHYTVVARPIGEETTGIAGTPVQVLGKLIAQRSFPKLWEVRSRLVELFEAERSGGSAEPGAGQRPIGHGD